MRYCSSYQLSGDLTFSRQGQSRCHECHLAASYVTTFSTNYTQERLRRKTSNGDGRSFMLSSFRSTRTLDRYRYRRRFVNIDKESKVRGIQTNKFDTKTTENTYISPLDRGIRFGTRRILDIPRFSFSVWGVQSF